MRKPVILVALLALFVLPYASLADDIIRGPLPDKFPGPEKCAECHRIQQTNTELKQSGHNDVKCLDCHIPGAVLRKKYESKDIGFERLGYHHKKGAWIETKKNEVCLRCHAEKGIKDTDEKCWSCHMPESGTDKLTIVKDKKLPPAGNNIREIKTLSHKSHLFKVHSKENMRP